MGGTRDHAALRMRAAYSSAMAARNLGDFLALSKVVGSISGDVVVGGLFCGMLMTGELFGGLVSSRVVASVVGLG
ncbi:hypothetical protein Tco_0935659 [Tanacetum coccineum]